MTLPDTNLLHSTAVLNCKTDNVFFLIVGKFLRKEIMKWNTLDGLLSAADVVSHGDVLLLHYNLIFLCKVHGLEVTR